MDERYEKLLFEGGQSPEARERLRKAMADDPELADAVRQWEQVRAALRRRLDARLPDRELLVLYALEQNEQTAHLTEAEQARLNEARAQIENALEAHPGLRDVVRDVQSASDEFEAVWNAYWHEQNEKATATERRAADRTPRPSRTHQAERNWTRRLALGTVLVAVAVIVLFLLPRGSETVTVEVSSGEQRVVNLADGSSVRLVGTSRLSYAPASNDESFNRRVSLDMGRAFFDVASASSPFMVETPTARTTVLGTSFGVRVEPEATEVILASGKVEVASRQKTEPSVVLTPGQASRVHQNQPPSSPETVDLSQALGWTGLFIFRETPLPTIAQRLGEHYGVTIELHPALSSEAVTGTFERDQAVRDILNVISTTLDAQVENPSSGTYRLVPARNS